MREDELLLQKERAAGKETGGQKMHCSGPQAEEMIVGMYVQLIAVIREANAPSQFQK
jgi:hypothetical protein